MLQYHGINNCIASLWYAMLQPEHCTILWKARSYSAINLLLYRREASLRTKINAALEQTIIIILMRRVSHQHKCNPD